MGKRKVQLLVNTKGAKRGDTIEVDPDLVDELVANRQVVEVKPGPKPSEG